MNYVEETRYKLLAVDCLKTLKQDKTYRELSKELKLPPGVVSRYVNGYVLPKKSRAEQIINYFSRIYLKTKLREKQEITKGKIFITVDLTTKPYLLNLIARHASLKFQAKINKVLTAAIDGIPIAIKIADIYGADSIYAKKTQEVTKGGYYMTRESTTKYISHPFYLPKILMKKNDDVLIVDDVIRSGDTVLLLSDLIKQARANLVGVFSIFATKAGIKKLQSKGYKVESLVID